MCLLGPVLVLHRVMLENLVRVLRCVDQGAHVLDLVVLVVGLILELGVGRLDLVVDPVLDPTALDILGATAVIPVVRGIVIDQRLLPRHRPSPLVICNSPKFHWRPTQLWQ